MEFRVLGPLEATVGECALHLGGPKQRSLLALLLINAGEVLTIDHIIEDLWPGESPHADRKAVQFHIWKLRKTFETETGPCAKDTVILSRGPGYVLDLRDHQLDSVTFETLVRRGHDSLPNLPQAANDYLSEAMALWRGPAYADVAYEEFAQPEIRRLNELRFTALEDKIETDLYTGVRLDLVAQLELLVASHPLRERLRGQLMRALCADNRPVEALLTYRDLEQVYAELGLKPPHDLKTLRDRILQRDPVSLD